MNAHKASMINAIILIAMSLWGYFASETPSMTAMIPAAFGVILLALNPGVKKENKVIAHIAVLLTMLILFALIMPFKGSIERGNTMAIIRIALMLLSTVFAIRYFVKSFIDAKKAREAASQS